MKKIILVLILITLSVNLVNANYSQNINDNIKLQRIEEKLEKIILSKYSFEKQKNIRNKLKLKIEKILNMTENDILKKDLSKEKEYNSFKEYALLDIYKYLSSTENLRYIKNINGIKYEEVTYKNFWNKFWYKQSDIKYIIPITWKSKIWVDIDSKSLRGFYDENNKNKNFYIISHFIWSCKKIYDYCWKEEVKRTWEEKLELLVEYLNWKWWKYTKTWYLKWLNKTVYISNDEKSYIFSINNNVIQLIFWTDLDSEVKNTILDSIKIDN